MTISIPLEKGGEIQIGWFLGKRDDSKPLSEQLVLRIIYGPRMLNIFIEKLSELISLPDRISQAINQFYTEEKLDIKKWK